MRLILGDCLDVLPTLEAGSVDAIVSDPPYGMGWRTDSSRFSGGGRNRGAGRADYGPIANDDRPFDPSPFLGFPKVILWGANHYARRLPVGTTLVWLKKGDHLFGTFLSDAEIGWQKGGHGVYCFRKTFTGSTRMKECPNGGRAAHPTQKPVALMEWCLKRPNLPEGATVLDPYMGTGTTAMACMRLGLDFIGCEIEPKYHAIAERRIAAALAERPLFAGDAG